MYAIKKQKMKKNTEIINGKAKSTYEPARAYSVDEFEDIPSFVEGIVETSQFRVRGYKYRLMEVVAGEDGGQILRFDWQASAPTE